MELIQPRAGQAADQVVDAVQIWKAALDEYQRITGVRLQTLDSVSNIDDLLAQVNKDEEKFNRYRHNGSKFDRFRTLIRHSLGPIGELGNIVTQAAKAVSSVNTERGIA